MRTIKIIHACLVVSLKQLLTYRFTAFLSLVFSLLLMAGEILVVDIYYRFDSDIGGWSEGAFFVLVGSLNIMAMLYTFLFEVAHDELVFNIRHGLLDYQLVRPIDSQLLTSICRFDYAALLGLPLPIWLVFHGLQMESLHVAPIQIAIYVSLLALGTLAIYLINQIAVGFSFWFAESTSFTLACDQLVQMGSKPRQFYPKMIRFGLAYVVPIVSCCTLSVTTFSEGLDWTGLLAAGLGVCLLAVLSRVQWKLGLKRYSSASS